VTKDPDPGPELTQWWAESRERCRKLEEELRPLGARLRLVYSSPSGEPMLAVIDWDHGDDNILPEEGESLERVVAALCECVNPVDAQPDGGPHD
jgi:hypothetical protein